MAKKKEKKFTAENFGTETAAEPAIANGFYFGRENYKWMLIGLALIALGFILMMGRGANTTPEGNFDPNYWNEGIFSFLRIRIAPFLVIAGFATEAYAILKRSPRPATTPE